jgi:hypothetical protein
MHGGARRARRAISVLEHLTPLASPANQALNACQSYEPERVKN